MGRGAREVPRSTIFVLVSLLSPLPFIGVRELIDAACYLSPGLASPSYCCFRYTSVSCMESSVSLGLAFELDVAFRI